MGHAHLQGRTRRERTLEASGRQKWTSRIRTSGVPDGHPRHDSRGGGKQRYQKGQENSTEENQIGGWVGQEGERRKSYSAAVIDGIKRNSRIYVGDSIVRKTYTRLSKEEDVVVCLPGARIEHVTERREDHGKRKGRDHTGTHRDE